MRRVIAALLIFLLLLAGGCAKSADAPDGGRETDAPAASPAPEKENEAAPAAEPTDDPAVPTSAEAEVNVPETTRQNAPTAPAEVPETQPSDPASEPSDPADQPTVPPTEPPSEPSEPSSEPTEPAQTGESVAEPAEPFVYKGLVELTAVDDSFVIDQRYATENNFTGVAHHDPDPCPVQQDVQALLRRANDAAKAEGYRIKIWDAYRPISVQQALHDSAPAELSAYVPAPGPYSMHARGITVDVTLCTLDGTELDMPTGFDDFSDHAHSDYAGATEEQKQNRELLNRFMSEAGFKRSKLEWWHFDGPNRDRYEILDVSFAEFENARNAR